MKNTLLKWCLWGGIGILSSCSLGGKDEPKVKPVQIDMRTERGFAPPAGKVIVPQKNFQKSFQGASQPSILTAEGILGTQSRAYKKDSAYRALNRYELPPPLRNHRANQVLRLREADLNAVLSNDKPLVLAGRGFEILTFDAHAAPRIRVEGFGFLAPETIRTGLQNREDHLDPLDEYLKSRRPMIFHSGATGFSGSPPSLPHLRPVPRKVSPAFIPQAVPETHLLMRRNESARLRLEQADHALDILAGNEKLNRRSYGKISKK